jgi:hypothetical protein
VNRAAQRKRPLHRPGIRGRIVVDIGEMEYEEWNHLTYDMAALATGINFWVLQRQTI